MQIQDCAKDQRVRNRESGQLGTVRDVHIDRGEATVIYDNGNITRSAVRALEPAGDAPAAAAAAAASGPQRACPQCAAQMPVAVTTCPQCGFQYGVTPARRGSPLTVLIVVLLVAAAAAFAIWKFVLAK